MKIVIDLQGAQSESRFRGIGRYSLALTRAMIRQKGRHEIIVALSGLFPETLLPLRRELQTLLPAANIRVWTAPGPVMAGGDGNDARRRAAELIREAFLAGLRPDVVLVSSLFEGYVDDAVTSIRRFAPRLPTAVVLYDLIPFSAPANYLPTRHLQEYYYGKIDFLKKADLLLSISAHARQDAIDRLGFPSRRIFNISSAADDVFCPGPLTEAQRQDLRHRHQIGRQFILCVPGGFDARKNIQNLLLAYARLPAALRRSHQLVIASRFSPAERAMVQQWLGQGRLRADEVRLLGYVNEADLVALYRLADLFVLPSLEEGFGLPALEAMACGAPAIGSNTSSIPEVIGRPDALFDPRDIEAMAAKITRVLADDEFREDLRCHGRQQSRGFSWDDSARKALAALASVDGALTKDGPVFVSGAPKPSLAVVTPMPPQRTGIADYSAELLPALAEFYDIDVVTAPGASAAETTPGPWRIRDWQWLQARGDAAGRVLYQMGNSPFHEPMLSMMAEIPGTVVLHDFFLSGLMSWLDCDGGHPNAWSEALFASHGYLAVKDRFVDPEAAKIRYPANFEVLKQAAGIIVHSAYARKLALDWYGDGVGTDWEVIPPLRSAVPPPDREAERRRLEIPPDAFVVGSFGFIDPTKLNSRLLEAWLASAPGRSPQGRLIFVGENHGGDYGAQLIDAIRDSGAAQRVIITGFAPGDTFRSYLAAVDVAVQLRTRSRGETSRTVLDCLVHGVPTIVNAHGSLAEFEPEALCMLPDNFETEALTGALDRLWQDRTYRRALGERGRRMVHERHSPAECARRYAGAIEAFHRRDPASPPALIRAICRENRDLSGDGALAALSRGIASALPPPRPARRLFLDVTGTCRNDLKTGIERVTRSLVGALLAEPPKGFRIEPVQLMEVGGWHYRQAHRFTLELLGCDPGILPETPIDPDAGDILLRLDLAGDMLVEAEASGLFADLRRRGVAVYSVVFDLLPIRLPGVFPPGADQLHTRWLQAAARSDGALCISRAVAEDLSRWLAAEGAEGSYGGAFRIGWFPLGADFQDAGPHADIAPEVAPVLQSLGARPSFLMVGTIEPRKGYLQALDAFSHLWRQGVEVNLVIVGREGWTHLPSSMRRDIPATLERLRCHPERGRRLFWLERIGDADLKRVYAAGTCLLAASYGEGFGLPLVEAARHGLPILARDIPVFREVAGEGASYFTAGDADAMARAVASWLSRRARGEAPASAGMPLSSWRESARAAAQFCIGGR